MITYDTKLPAAARAIRTTVFIEEQGYRHEFDDIDTDAIHFVAYEGDTAVGTCRLYPCPRTDDWQLGRLAVLATARGRGIGRQLLDAAAKYARRHRATGLLLYAQLHAVPFYAQAGYQETGERIADEGHPHAAMYLALSPTYSQDENYGS